MVGRTNRREDSPRKSACITVLQQSDIDFWTLCKSFYACLPRQGGESIPYTKHRTWIPMFLFEVAPLKFARLPLSGDLPILAYFIVRLGRVPTPPCPDIYKGSSHSLSFSHIPESHPPAVLTGLASFPFSTTSLKPCRSSPEASNRLLEGL